MSKVKPTTFQKGPNSVVAVKDVYRQDVLDHANTYSVTDRITDAATNYLGDFNTDPGSIMDAVNGSMTSSADGIGIDGDKLKKRIGRTVGIPTSFSDITSRQQGKILSKIEEMTGLKGLKVLVGDGTSSIKGGFSDATSIVDLVNKMAGNSKLIELLDLGTEAGLITTVTDKLLEWNVIEVVDNIIDKMRDSKAKNEALEMVTLKAAMRGNLSQTKHFAEKMGQSRSYAIREDIISALISCFNFNDDDNRPYGVIGNELIAFFAWMDPMWDKDQQKQSFTSLKYYILASSDAKEVLNFTEQREFAAAGSIIKYKDIPGVVRETFPELIVW